MNEKSKYDESAKKQIEEMAKVIAKADDTCRAQTISETLYNAGYRKQSENVIELPCKVGDKVYQTDGVKIYESTINEITLTTHKMICVTENVAFDKTAIGKSIFLTKNEAEAKAEAATEIFGEIDAIINYSDSVSDAIAELKKKYMEERLNEQRQSGDQDIQLQGMREPQHPDMH